jgi:excisionase family DNA binding protein
MDSKVERSTMKAKEAGIYLGVSYWKLLDMVKKKEIPSINIGKKIYFRVETLKEWQLEKENSSLKKEEIQQETIIEKKLGKLRKVRL